jgi:hypothetical protein
MLNQPQKNDDEGSVKGKGPAVMLPARGNPFDQQTSASSSAAPQGAAAMAAIEPRDLSPDDLAALFPTSHSDRDVPSPVGAGATMDATTAAPPESSVEDWAALSPSSHEDRQPSESPDEGLQPEVTTQPVTEPITQPVTQLIDQPQPTTQPTGDRRKTPPPQSVTILEQPSQGGTVLNTVMAGGQDSSTPGTVLQVSGDVAITSPTYKPGQPLPSNKELVDMFVPNARLVTIWAEIDDLENQVSSLSGVSRKLALELVARLAVARNYLMNNRDQFEEAGQEVAIVKYYLNRVRTSSFTQRPRPILGFLTVFLVLLVIGFLSSTTISNYVKQTVPSATIDFGTVWITILWGGVGGWFGAIYNLWAHVARDQDYDPQFALWYYTNPIIGLILGALVYVVIRTGIVVAAGTEIQPAPYVIYGMYVLAWAVGFQQNLALSLVNSVLKKLIPQDEKGGKASTPEPPGSASVGGSSPNPPTK